MPWHISCSFFGYSGHVMEGKQGTSFHQYFLILLPLCSFLESMSNVFFHSKSLSSLFKRHGWKEKEIRWCCEQQKRALPDCRVSGRQSTFCVLHYSASFLQTEQQHFRKGNKDTLSSPFCTFWKTFEGGVTSPCMENKVSWQNDKCHFQPNVSTELPCVLHAVRQRFCQQNAVLLGKDHSHKSVDHINQNDTSWFQFILTYFFPSWDLLVDYDSHLVSLNSCFYSLWTQFFPLRSQSLSCVLHQKSAKYVIKSIFPGYPFNITSRWSACRTYEGVKFSKTRS